MESYIVYKVMLTLFCCITICEGNLTMQSSSFECGKTATIVCSRTSNSVNSISWHNRNQVRICVLTICQLPVEGNYRFSANGGVWTLTIDPVEWKDNNITFTCETPSPGIDAPVRVSSTIIVSAVIDDTSTLTIYENVIDTKLMAMSNCVYPVGTVKITWQCVQAYNIHIIDVDCQLEILSTYTSKCNDINRPCAGHGTFFKGSVAVMPVYRGERFKWVKVKAIFTDGTNIIEKVSGRLRQEVKELPRLLLLSPKVNFSTTINSSLTMTCSFTGLVQNADDSFVISWFRDGSLYWKVNHNCVGFDESNNKINMSCPDLNHQQLTINKVDTTLNKTVWRCEIVIYAANGSTYETSSESNRLIVEDVPTVLVTGNNSTVNDASAVLQCTLSQVPQEYTHYKWQHIWPGYGIVQHHNGLGNSSTLTLSSLTHEYSGIYKCFVSFTDGIGRNMTVRYGAAFLNVETFPVTTTTSPIKYYTRLPGVVTVFVDYYSNRDDNNVKCFWRSDPIKCSSQLLKGDIDLPVFGTNIKTKGTIAKISFTLLRAEHYGMYTIRISNDIGESSLDVDVIPAVSEATDTKPLDTCAIVGGSVGGGMAVLVSVVIILVWITCTRRQVTTFTENTLARINKPDTLEKSENISPQGDTSGIDLEVDEGVYYNIERNTHEELHDRQGDTHDYDVSILQNGQFFNNPKYRYNVIIQILA